MDGFTKCEATSQSLDFESFQPMHRKGKKLLAEKKRRARINNCLMRIRDIVCNGEEEKETDLDKMEKAEILEKTLEVLTRVRHEFDHTRRMSSLSTQKAMAVRYASGFSSCAEESIRYIQNSRLIPLEVKHQLQTHLRSISRRMESKVQEEQCESYTHPYTTPPSVIIAPPQIVPLTSETASNLKPGSSLSLMVSDSDATPATAQLHISPSQKNYFHTSDVRDINQHTENMLEHRNHSIPSPIHSSTPVSHIEDNNRTIPTVSHKVFHEHSSSIFIPVCNAELSQEHKENQPREFHYNIPDSTERSHENLSGSAFRKIPSQYCRSSSPQTESQSHLSRNNASISSSSPSGFSSSQYSPISPVQSPVIVHTSALQSHHQCPSSEHQTIYNYHGYEPFPMYSHTLVKRDLSLPSVGVSPSETPQFQTPNKAIDLCVKRNDSHNISPETMWRPW